MYIMIKRYLSKKIIVGLNKRCSAVYYIFIMAMVLPTLNANAKELMSEAATEDNSIALQNSINNSTWSMPSGEVGRDLILNNGHVMSCL